MPTECERNSTSLAAQKATTTAITTINPATSSASEQQQQQLELEMEAYQRTFDMSDNVESGAAENAGSHMISKSQTSTTSSIESPTTEYSTTTPNGLKGSTNGGDSKKTSLVSPDPTSYVTKARVTRPIPPPPSCNPLQFVQIKPCNLYQTAQEQLKKAEEVKKIKEIKKEEPEDWQNNLDNWKSSRRKRVEHIIDRVVEVKKLELEEHDRSRRKSKTFSEMIEERGERAGGRGRTSKLTSLAVYNEDESNDLSDLGIGTSSASGKSSLSEDYDNNSVTSDNAELDKAIQSEQNYKSNIQKVREYISSPGYETSSSTAPASSPDPCEYTYEGAIQDYKQRISRATNSGSSGCFNKINGNGHGNNNHHITNGNDEPTAHSNKQAPTTLNLQTTNKPSDPTANTEQQYTARRGHKIEDRLLSFEITSPSAEDSQIGADKPKVDVPKVDITKRKEIFENQKQQNATNTNGNGVAEHVPRVNLRERFKFDASTAEQPQQQKEVKRLSGDLTSIRQRLQSLEQQKDEKKVALAAAATTSRSIDMPSVPPLKERLSSLQNAVNKEEIKKPPVALVDARQLEIMRKEEETAKQRMQENKIVDKNIIVTPAPPAELDDSGILTTDEQETGSENLKRRQRQQQQEQEAQLNAAIAALAIEEQQLEEAANAVNQIEAEFDELNSSTATTAATLASTVGNSTNQTQQLPYDMDFSINEALELALEAIDRENKLTTANDAVVNDKENKIKNNNNNKNETTNQKEIKKELEILDHQVKSEEGNVENEMDTTIKGVVDESQEQAEQEALNYMLKQQQEQQETITATTTTTTTIAQTAEIKLEPIYENIATENLAATQIIPKMNSHERMTINKSCTDNNNDNNNQQQQQQNSTQQPQQSQQHHNQQQRNQKQSQINNHHQLHHLHPHSQQTNQNNCEIIKDKSNTLTTITTTTTQFQQQQQQQQLQQNIPPTEIEPYYQVPKSSEPYYDAPKHLRPVPVYENIEIFYNGHIDNGNGIGNSSTPFTSAATTILNNFGILEPPKEKPPPPPAESPPPMHDTADDQTDTWSSSDNTYETISSRHSGSALKTKNALIGEQQPISPPLKRVNSTKRIKKELRNKRSSFLGIDPSALDDEEHYLEMNVAPPPDMAQFLQQERQLEKQLYMKATAGLCDSSDTGESRDSGVSENHSRQSSEHYTNSSEENERHIDVDNSSEHVVDLAIYRNENAAPNSSAQPISLLQTVKGDSAESWTASATAAAAAAAASQTLTEATATANAKINSIEEKIREQEEVLRVERELLQLEQEELKRQRENLMLRENMARRELQHGAKMLMSANRRSLQELNGGALTTIQTPLAALSQLPTKSKQQQQQIYANIPNLEQQYYQMDIDYRKSMSDLHEFSAAAAAKRNSLPPVPPTKPMRAIHLAATTQNSPAIHHHPHHHQQQQNHDYLVMTTAQQRFGGSLVKIAAPAPISVTVPPTAAPRSQTYTNLQHRSQQNLSSNSNSSNSNNPQHGNMTRNTLHALSATPKPKYTDGWVQQQQQQFQNRNHFANDPAWLTAYQQKRKSMPASADAAANSYAYNNNHWLVQEAEQRRLNDEQTRRSLSTGNTPLHQTTKTNGGGSNGKPLPDAIIQTLTERVQSKGIGERKRLDNYKTPDRSPLHAASAYHHHSHQLPQQQQQQSATPRDVYNNTNQSNATQTSTHANNQDKVLSVSGKKKCSHCGDELGRGAAMIIESLLLFYHINCFKCCVCHVQLGDGLNGTDVRVRNHKLHCQNCYSSDDGVKFSCV